MTTLFPASETVIFFAGLFQICGYLLINQVLLRFAMLIGSALYVTYYFIAAESPLWGAIIVSSLTICSILIGLAGLYAQNAKWAIPKSHADLYRMFDQLEPGDFRRIMKPARRHILNAPLTATQQGERPAALYFVVSGVFHVNKGRAAFDVPGPTFVGEVAMMLQRPSVATTTLPAGIEVLEWKTDDLMQLSAKYPRFKLAMEAVISRDLARKVALAVAPEPD